MNHYDHEDAFKEANLCAGRAVNLPEAIKLSLNKDQARLMILQCQDQYLALFDAFIQGVAWGRNNPTHPHNDSASNNDNIAKGKQE